MQRAPTNDDSKGIGALAGRQKRKAANVASDAYLDKKPPAGSGSSSPEGGTAEPDSNSDSASDGSGGEARGNERSMTLSSESESEAASEPLPVRGRRAKAVPAQPRGQQRATRNAGKTSAGMYDENVPLSALGAHRSSHCCTTVSTTTDTGCHTGRPGNVGMTVCSLAYVCACSASRSSNRSN